MTQRRKILVFGAGGHAKVVIDIIEKQGLFNIEGITDWIKENGDITYGYKVLGDANILERTEYAYINEGIVAIGDNWARSQVVNKIRSLRPEFRFITAIHPTAAIARGVRIGAGTVLMAGTVVNSDVCIGSHSIINTRASVDHDCVVGDYVSIGPGASIGGKVSIQNFTAVSLGSDIIHDIRVGEHAVVGAGAVVVNDIGECTVVCGIPARVVRTREIGERYL